MVHSLSASYVDLFVLMLFVFPLISRVGPDAFHSLSTSHMDFFTLMLFTLPSIAAFHFTPRLLFVFCLQDFFWSATFSFLAISFATAILVHPLVFYCGALFVYILTI